MRAVKNGQPKVLVPAYIEKGLGSKYTIEFLVYQPEPDFSQSAESAFGRLFNLSALAWNFRRRLIEERLETFMNLRSLGAAANADDVHRKVQKFKLVYGSTLLEALNREVDSPRQVEKCFPRKEDQERIQQILNLENGLYRTYSRQLHAGIEANDVDKIVGSLSQLRNVNKTLLVMTAARLEELAKEKDGDLL